MHNKRTRVRLTTGIVALTTIVVSAPVYAQSVEVETLTIGEYEAVVIDPSPGQLGTQSLEIRFQGTRISLPTVSGGLHVANDWDELPVLETAMTPEQLAEAQRLAREWTEAHPR